jgi:hypothetical protein
MLSPNSGLFSSPFRHEKVNHVSDSEGTYCVCVLYREIRCLLESIEQIQLLVGNLVGQGSVPQRGTFLLPRCE